MLHLFKAYMPMQVKKKQNKLDTYWFLTESRIHASHLKVPYHHIILIFGFLFSIMASSGAATHN